MYLLLVILLILLTHAAFPFSATAGRPERTLCVHERGYVTYCSKIILCIQDTLSSRAALGLGRVRRASKGILHTSLFLDLIIPLILFYHEVSLIV